MYYMDICMRVCEERARLPVFALSRAHADYACSKILNRTYTRGCPAHRRRKSSDPRKSYIVAAESPSAVRSPSFSPPEPINTSGLYINEMYIPHIFTV